MDNPNPQKLRINEFGYNEKNFIEIYSGSDETMEITGPYHIVIFKRIRQAHARAVGIISLEGMRFQVRITFLVS